MQDELYMRRALALAARGAGKTSPNPMVGAVLVREGRVLGEGYHAVCGGPHAERVALASCQENPRGATLYVTLEPCCHQGRTPPCTEAILEAGLSRVVVGAIDPNPKVRGGGVSVLRAAGLVVETGLLGEECRLQNEVFFHFMQTGRPFTLLKYAMTMDGKLATKTGASRWITGERARRRVHEDRARYAAICVGLGTLLADDPRLDCRLPEGGGRNPLRVLCDSEAACPPSAQLLQTADRLPTLLATCCRDEKKLAPLRALGCRVLTLPRGADGELSLPALEEHLGAEGIDSLIVEGGAQLHWSFLQAGLVSRVQCYLAPKLFGGAAAKSPLGGLGVDTPSEAFLLSPPRLTHLGEDLLLESEVRYPCSQES